MLMSYEPLREGKSDFLLRRTIEFLFSCNLLIYVVAAVKCCTTTKLSSCADENGDETFKFPNRLISKLTSLVLLHEYTSATIRNN